MEGYRMQTFFTKRNLIFVTIVAFVLVFIFIVYDNLHFRLRSTSPSLESVATSSVEIKYHFSQPVDSIRSATLNGSDITNAIEINNKTVSIPIDVSLSDSSTYEIVLKSVDSKWFDNTIESIKRSFTPKYIDFNKLSDDEKKAQIDESSSGQVDDNFIDNNVFPIFNERWQIEATVVKSDRVAILEVSFFEEIPDYDNGGVIKQVADNIANQYEKEVINEIKKRGGNPENYTIVYKTNKYLYEKYNDSDSAHGD